MNKAVTARKAAAAKSRRFAKAAASEEYVLRLYVAGLTPRSRSAIENITSICEEYLQGRYDLEVIDVFKRPVLAREEQIIATPTLVKKLPAPLRRFIGDLSTKEKVLVGLDLRRQG
jgi:circadian clock protein KaiB